MRPMSRRLFARFNSDNFQPVEMLEILLPGGDPSSAIRLTTNESAFTWNTFTYTPFPIARGQIDERLTTTSGDVPAVTVTIGNVDAQWAKILGGIQIEGATTTLRLTDKQLLADLRVPDTTTIALGEVRDSMLSDRALTFRIVSVIGQMERITIPLRVFQSNCNYVFGSASCGVDITASPIAISSTVNGCTNKRIDVPIAVLTTAGTPADPTDFWSNGYIIMKNGACALQSRPIQRVENIGTALRFWLRTGFMSPPAIGDGVVIKRNCRRTLNDCAAYQGNFLPYGGFPNVPPERFTPNQVKRGVKIS